MDLTEEHCRVIFDMGFKKFLDPAEIRIILGFEFGDINKMDDSKFDEAKRWILNNSFRIYQILEPAKHLKLMETDNDYSVWFRQEERKKTYK